MYGGYRLLLEKWYLNIHFVIIFVIILFFILTLFFTLSILIWYLCKYLLFYFIFINYGYLINCQSKSCSNNISPTVIIALITRCVIEKMVCGKRRKWILIWWWKVPHCISFSLSLFDFSLLSCFFLWFVFFVWVLVFNL